MTSPESILTDLINATHPSWGWKIVSIIDDTVRLYAEKKSTVWDVWAWNVDGDTWYNVQVCIKGASPLESVVKRIAWVHKQSDLEMALDSVRIDALNKMDAWREDLL